jgi:hypothetical protein
MKIELQYRGQKFAIYAIVVNDGSCPAIEFLEQLKRNDIASHKSIVNIYRRHAECGPILNIRKSRRIEGHDKLLEFKSKQGARLIYFYLPDGKTVITHGFKKGAPAEEEYDKAEKMRAEYLKEVKNG